MADLLQALTIEEEHVNQTLLALQQARNRQPRTIIELSAMATFMHNTYNGIENLLKRALRHRKVQPPDSASSHRDLLDLAVEHTIITQALSERLNAYRGFRHFFVHGYGVMLNEAQLMPLVDALPEVWDRFKTELLTFATDA
jgi:uncharacterized protein YutE (UPF0331/DUF86 family)